MTAIPPALTRVTRKPAALGTPLPQPGGEKCRYGVAFPFQVAPRKAALSVSLRVEGYPVGDFENGADVILFDDHTRIATANAIPVTRNEKYVHRQTGEKRIAIKYPIVGGFVPLGVLRADGSLHPHAGTGFGLSEVLDFPMKGNGYYQKEDKTTAMVRETDVWQFGYDGKEFHVIKSERKPPADPVRMPDSNWALIAPGLTQAIADGDDFLYPVFATQGNPGVWMDAPMASGVARWVRRSGAWQPVSFVPVAASPQPNDCYWMEPSLIRDGDDALLFSARGCFGGFDHVVRVWKSADNGATWEMIIDLAEARAQATVTINRAADGTPYIVANVLGHERDWLSLWPLKADRSGLEDSITVRNALDEFGPPPSGVVWFVDHPTGATVQLGDGRWHHLLSYRIMDRGEHAGCQAAPQTGQYIEEVISAGPAIPAWKFA